MKLLKIKHLEETFQCTSTQGAPPLPILQAGLRKEQWSLLIVSESTPICICCTYSPRFWHSSLLSYPTGYGELGVRLHETGTSVQSHAGSTLASQFCQEVKDQLKFGASSLPTSFSSSFPQSLKMHTHNLSSFHRRHDIKLTELWLFDIQADNRTALLSNTLNNRQEMWLP